VEPKRRFYFCIERFQSFRRLFLQRFGGLRCNLEPRVAVASAQDRLCSKSRRADERETIDVVRRAPEFARTALARRNHRNIYPSYPVFARIGEIGLASAKPRAFDRSGSTERQPNTIA
jgi:hypothetical protein